MLTFKNSNNTVCVKHAPRVQLCVAFERQKFEKQSKNYCENTINWYFCNYILNYGTKYIDFNWRIL